MIDFLIWLVGPAGLMILMAACAFAVCAWVAFKLDEWESERRETERKRISPRLGLDVSGNLRALPREFGSLGSSGLNLVRDDECSAFDRSARERLANVIKQIVRKDAEGLVRR